MKLFPFNKIKLKKQTKRLSVWFLKLSFKKYRLNNLLMLFYFSNVERQRFFPFSYTFRHDFFIRRMEEEHFLGRALIAFERQRLYLFRQSQEWTSYLQNEHFSSYSLKILQSLFCHRSKKKLRSHPILTEPRFTRDMLIKTVLIWFDCKIVALKDQ